MTTSKLKLRSRLKGFTDALQHRDRDLETLACVCASGLLAGFLVLTGLPETRFARDLLLFLLALLLCRIAALLMKPA